jgi:hypothetical protein
VKLSGRELYGIFAIDGSLLEHVLKFDLGVDGAADRGSVHLALVALVTESEVDVLAVAAEPVSNSLRVTRGVVDLERCDLFDCGILEDRGSRHGDEAAEFLGLFGLHIFRQEGGYEVRSGSAQGRGAERVALETHTESISSSRLGVDLSGDFQVLGKALDIFHGLKFLASEATLATVEVVIEALSADPSVLREFETLLSPFGLAHLERSGNWSHLLSLVLTSYGLLRFIWLKGNDVNWLCRLLGLSLGFFNFNSRFISRLLTKSGNFYFLCLRNENARFQLLSHLMLFAGLNLSEDCVAASRLRALCEYSLSLEVSKLHLSSGLECLSLTWLSSALFLLGLIIFGIFHFNIGQFGDDILVGGVAILVLYAFFSPFNVEQLVLSECT